MSPGFGLKLIEHTRKDMISSANILTQLVCLTIVIIITNGTCCAINNYIAQVRGSLVDGLLINNIYY